jgi:hypothetical protein
MSPRSAYFASSAERVKLPKPDMKNITVLTRNLPNNPILPWNHYDSPWLEAEGEADTQEPEETNQATDQVEARDRVAKHDLERL